MKHRERKSVVATTWGLSGHLFGSTISGEKDLFASYLTDEKPEAQREGDLPIWSCSGR